MSNNYIWSIIEDNSGNLWIGTYGGGLNLFDRQKKRFYHFQHDPKDEKTIGSNYIFGLYFDKNNSLWIGTENSGLNKLNIHQDPTSNPNYAFQKCKHDKNNRHQRGHPERVGLD